MCKIFNINTGQEVNIHAVDNLVLSIDHSSLTYTIIKGTLNTYNALAAIATLEDAGYTNQNQAEQVSL